MARPSGDTNTAPSTEKGVDGAHAMLLTVDETADLLRTTRTAVYALASRGQLPGVTRLGRRVLVRSQDLLDWLDQKRAPSPKE